MFRRLLAALRALWLALLPRAWRDRLRLRSLRPVAARRQLAEQDPAESQQKALRAIVERHRQTEFGRTHAFEKIHTATDFARHVPARQLSQLEPYFERARSDSRVLVEGQVLGHLGELGLPITREALAGYELAEAQLAQHVAQREPASLRGQWLEIIPLQLDGTRQALPLVARTRAAVEVPPGLFRLADAEQRYHLLLRLAMTRPLSVLRAANPGTLTVLAEQLERQADTLLAGLETGAVQCAGALPEAEQAAVNVWLGRPDRARAQTLRRAAASRGRLEPRDVWPELRVLLCGASAAARASAERLHDRYGDLAVLDDLAWMAEMPVGMPVNGELRTGAFVPLLEGQYLEAQTASGELLSLQQLRRKERYRPVLTSHHGLYRAVLDQELEVQAIQRPGLPELLRVGRQVVPLSIDGGELSERMLLEAVGAACRGCELVIGAHMTWMNRTTQLPEAPVRGSWLSRVFRRAPDAAAQARTGLLLVVEPLTDLVQEQAERLRATVEAELLRRSGPYAAARASKQLAAVGLVVLTRGTTARWRAQALADGVPDAHEPLPAIVDRPMVLADAEVALRLS